MEKGLVVERIPIYWNEKVVDETINVSLHYRLSNFKDREYMYDKMLNDIEEVRRNLIIAQENIRSDK